MKKLILFNDYQLEMIFEALTKDELILVLSKDLRSIIMDLDHPIAKDIIEVVEGDNNDKFKVTYLDIDYSDHTKKDIISFLNSNKLIDNIIKDEGFEKNDILTPVQMSLVHTIAYNNVAEKFALKNRSKTKFGRIIGKLFPGKYKQSGKPGEDIESFVNMYKAARETGDFGIVKGEDMRKWYLGDNYTLGGGSLNKSCMRLDHCQEFMDFYVDNKDKISMIILKDENDKNKIRGRAILWELEEPSGKTFMDRIYTVKDSDILLFKDYAKEKRWLHKVYQNMDSGGPFIDTRTSKETYNDLVVNKLTKPKSDYYPYMDTMKFFDGDTISNSIGNVDSKRLKILDHTDGSYDNEGDGTWSDYYNDIVNEDEMVWCEYGDGYRYDGDYFWSHHYNVNIAKDYVENNMIILDYYDDDDKYRNHGDYVTTYENNTCSPDFAENNFYWSEWEKKYVENAVWSEYHYDYIVEKDAIAVYTNARASQTDWRKDNPSDGDYWVWDYDDEEYCNDVTKEELEIENGFQEVYLDVEQHETGYVESDYWIWDYDGEKYSNDVTEEKLREYHELDDEE